jgi:hypothetical protein
MIPAIIKPIRRTETIKPIVIHNGERTHHYDQLITPTNLRTTKINVNTSATPIPFFLLLSIRFSLL